MAHAPNIKGTVMIGQAVAPNFGTSPQANTKSRSSRALRLAVPLLIALGLAGCGGKAVITMPDVTGKKLDIAYDKIANAGFDDKDKVKIEGGGTFGVVFEGNWTVCERVARFRQGRIRRTDFDRRSLL